MTKNINITFPVLGPLGVVFIVMKLIGYVDWSWWIVLLPLYAVPALGVGLIVLGLILTFIAGLLS